MKKTPRFDKIADFVNFIGNKTPGLMKPEDIIRNYPNARFLLPQGMGILWNFSLPLGLFEFQVETEKGRELKTIPPHMAKPILKPFTAMSTSERLDLKEATGVELKDRGSNINKFAQGQDHNIMQNAIDWLRSKNIDADNLIINEKAINEDILVRSVLPTISFDALLEDENKVFALYDLFEGWLVDTYANFLIEVGWYCAVRRVQEIAGDKLTEKQIDDLIHSFTDYFPLKPRDFKTPDGRKLYLVSGIAKENYKTFTDGMKKIKDQSGSGRKRK